MIHTYMLHFAWLKNWSAKDIMTCFFRSNFYETYIDDLFKVHAKRNDVDHKEIKLYKENTGKK